MSASIQAQVYTIPGGSLITTVVDTSLNTIVKGNQIVLTSVDEGTTYNWALSYTPSSADGTASTAALDTPTARVCRFTADWDGAYLLRLVIDAGLVTEDTIYVRMRILSRFGQMQLISAGERRDAEGIIPIDTPNTGWADFQNLNVQRLLAFTRRVSTSGRVLYVDANRGRDNSEDQNDATNMVSFPGPDPLAREETGIEASAVGFGDFYSINDAITYAAAAASRGEAATSLADPYWIVLRPGLYEENLVLQPYIHLVSDETSSESLWFTSLPDAIQAVLRTTGAIIKTNSIDPATAFHQLVSTGVTPTVMPSVILEGISLENTVVSTNPTLLVDGAALVLMNSTVFQTATGASQGPAIKVDSLGGVLIVDGSGVGRAPTGDGERYAIEVDGPSQAVIQRNSSVAGDAGILMNPNLVSGPPAPSLLIEESTITGSFGYALRGFPGSLSIRKSRVLGNQDGASIDPNVSFLMDDNGASIGGGSVSFNTTWTLSNCQCGTEMQFDPGLTTGTTELNLHNVQYDTLTFVNAPTEVPDSINSDAHAYSMFYNNFNESPLNPGAGYVVPLAYRLGDQNIQDALDELANRGSAVAPTYTQATVQNGIAAPNVTVTTQQIVGITMVPAAIPIGVTTVNLPATTSTVGRQVTVKDESGTIAGVGGIDIQVSGGGNIDGGAVVNLGNWGSGTFYLGADTEWHAI